MEILKMVFGLLVVLLVLEVVPIILRIGVLWLPRPQLVVRNFNLEEEEENSNKAFRIDRANNNLELFEILIQVVRIGIIAFAIPTLWVALSS